MEIYLKEPLSGASTAPRMGTALADRETVGKREETCWHLETLEFLARGPLHRPAGRSPPPQMLMGCFPRAFVAAGGPTQRHPSLFISVLLPQSRKENALLT